MKLHSRFHPNLLRWSILNLIPILLFGCASSGNEVKTDAATPKGLACPQWREGDAWIHHGPNGQFTSEVEYIDDQEIILKSGKTRYYYDHDFALLRETTDDKLTLEYQPPYKGWRFFPLWVGKEWETQWKEINHRDGSVQNFSEKMKVSGWENIMTYGGTSRALKIDILRINLGTNKKFHRTVWYAPEMKNFTRVMWKEIPNMDRTLSEFKQGSGGKTSQPGLAKAQPPKQAQPPSQPLPEKAQRGERKEDPSEKTAKRLDEIYNLMLKENFLTPEELSEVFETPSSDALIYLKLDILVSAVEQDFLPFQPMFYLALEKENYDDAELIRRTWVVSLYRVSEFLAPRRHIDPRIEKAIERADLQIEKLEIVGLTDPLLVRLRKELSRSLDAKKWDDAQKIQSLIVSRTEELRPKQLRDTRPPRAEKAEGRIGPRPERTVETPPPGTPKRPVASAPPSAQPLPETQAGTEEAQETGGDSFTKVLGRIGGMLIDKGTVSGSDASGSQAGAEGTSEYLTEDVMRAMRLIKGKGREKELTNREKGTLQLLDVLMGVVKKK